MDGQDVEQMLASKGFALLSARIQQQLERERQSCESETGETLLRAQGAVAALRSVLSMPTKLIAESKAARERNG